MVQPVNALREAKEKVVGLKQTLRAIQQGRIKMVLVANDIEDHVMKKIVESCRVKEIPIIPANFSQKELGRLCQIEVGAAVVGLIN